MEKLCIKLEEILSDISFCGLKNINADMHEGLSCILKNMSEAGFETGSKMLQELYNEITAFKHGETDGEKAVSLICSLECYIKNISNTI